PTSIPRNFFANSLRLLNLRITRYTSLSIMPVTINGVPQKPGQLGKGAESKASSTTGSVGRKLPAKKAPGRPSAPSSSNAMNGINGAMNGAMSNLSPYQIMASRIMNRVGEMAENITFAEK
ncbi:hypothetical protein LTS18_011504, partial [Coniosporium uncinatum]